MQYLLTEEEYKNLVPRTMVEDRDAALKMVRDMIQPKCKDGRYGDCVCAFCPIGKMSLSLFYGFSEDDADLANLICQLDKDYPA